jgi:cleavage and polyadenylation specificity factor subunit 1
MLIIVQNQISQPTPLKRYRLHGNVESLAVLKSRQDDLTGQRMQHDSLVLAFRDAKISVVEWDDDEQRLRTR